MELRDRIAAAAPEELAVGVTSAFLALTAIGLGLGFGLERMLPHRRIWSDRVPAGQYRHEAIGNVVFLAVAIPAFTALLASHAVRLGEESAGRAVLTFGALFLGFQAYFYVLHRALHHPRLVALHRWHHVSRITTPLSGQSVSLGEAIGWTVGYVGLPLALASVFPISASGWAWYMAFNVIGNIAGHANVEVVPLAPGLRARSLFATVFTYHALHHLRWTGHYGFASTWADRLLGTEWPDWMALYERVARGEPLELARTRRVEDP